MMKRKELVTLLLYSSVVRAGWKLRWKGNNLPLCCFIVQLPEHRLGVIESHARKAELIYYHV